MPGSTGSDSMSIVNLRLLILLLLCCLFLPGCSSHISPQQQWDKELMTAAKAVDYESLRRALDNGANPNADNGNKGTAMGMVMRSYKRSHMDRRLRIENCVEALLQHHADPEGLHHGFTPLQIAAGQGSERIIRLLICRGANPSGETAAGLAPIWQPVRKNDYRTGLVLLQAGADPNSPNAEGQTPLEYLKAKGHSRTRLMQALRQYGGH